MTQSMIRQLTVSFVKFAFTESSYRYAATRGLFYSHMGWIFFKPTYERMRLVERDDLEKDLGGWNI